MATNTRRSQLPRSDRIDALLWDQAKGVLLMTPEWCYLPYFAIDTLNEATARGILR